MFNKEIETLPREKMAALQSKRLIATVKRVYENVPFYKKSFDEKGLRPEDIKSVEDLKKLPFTLKQDLRDNYPYGLFACPMEDIVRIHASSGTTGKQTVVGYTANDISMWAESMARALAGAGGTSRDVIHISYGYGLFTGGLGAHYGAERLGAATVPVSTGNTKRQIQIMQDFGSTLLCCTPSYALYLAEAIEEAGIDPKKLSLRSGLFGAEPWTENMRAEIERRLDIKAHDVYGLSEIIGPG
ncbi:MAG: AMP-binding protein, partial [Bacillota bacterium]|nr:AMP-binding protein [Bacillota bacterium]